MEKAANVLITQISAAAGGNQRSGVDIFGLGDDQQVYRWNNAEHKWYRYAN